jgi:hypothetical protein
MYVVFYILSYRLCIYRLFHQGHGEEDGLARPQVS